MAIVSCTIPCNLCGNLSAERVGTTDREGKPLRTVLCTSCGLVWTDPRPDTAANRKFYSEEYRLQYKSAYVPKRKHVYRETLRAIARYEAIASLVRPGAKLLDVGSGAGFFPYVARNQGIDAQGIEPNRGFAEYAIDTFEVPTTNAFFQDVELPVEHFDLITMNHVLEHVEDPVATLRQLRQWLKPSGFLVVEVPNVEATYHAPQNRYHVGHLYNFSPATLKRLGEKSGLVAFESTLVTTDEHIHITFKRGELADGASEDFTLPKNYQRVAKILQRHTAWRHYGSTVPYRRFVKKQAQYLLERRAVRGEVTPREIADSLVARQLPSSNRQAA